VLAGGELAALCVIESVVRLLPGALGNDESSVDETFSDGLLEYPHYTKPARFGASGCPRYCVRATTRASRAGAGPRRCTAPWHAGRT
jgi:tRNA (guanine-N1)-methyltransferase